jgi:hypothetical protein
MPPERISSSASTSRSIPSPSQDRVARSLRSNTTPRRIGITARRRPVATRGGSTKRLKPACTPTARRNPGKNQRRDERSRRPVNPLPRIANIAVVVPCMIAVPKPRTTQSPGSADWNVYT